jgi:TrmH family RNA methyltransferase
MINSRQNRTFKNIRRLRRCKGDHALLEGPHLIHEALEAGHQPDLVLVTAEFRDRPEGRKLRSVLPSEPTEIATELLDGLTDSDSPRGALALVQLPRGGPENLPRTGDGLYLYIDRLQDPGNLGALARTAEAFDATGLALAPGTVDPNHPRALRASAGSLLRIPVAVGTELQDLDEYLEESSPVWIALVPRGGETLDQATLGRPAVLALGAEGPGLADELVARADLRLTIPVAEPVESLNATVAASLVLYELRRLVTH